MIYAAKRLASQPVARVREARSDTLDVRDVALVQHTEGALGGPVVSEHGVEE